MADPVIVQLRTKYLDLVNKEADWSSRYGRDHLAVVNLRRQIREIRASIFDELKRIAETYKNDLAIAQQRQAAVEKALADAKSHSTEDSQSQSALLDLEAAAKSKHSLYDEMQQRYTQSAQSEPFAASNARLVEAATPPLQKSSPKSLKILAIAAFGGLAIGGGIGLLRELLDRVFRTSQQIEHSLQTTCLALIPALKGEALSNSPSDLPEQSASFGHTGPNTIVRERNIIWTVSESPFSRFAESIRSLKLAVDLNRMDRPHSVVGFTSAIPNEGKSTIAASLALLIAQVGARVILVDGDFRNPSLSRALTPAANRGILEVISGRASVEDVVWRDLHSNLNFLPAFIPFRLPNSSEILSNDRTVRLFENLP